MQFFDQRVQRAILIRIKRTFSTDFCAWAAARRAFWMGPKNYRIRWVIHFLKGLGDHFGRVRKTTDSGGLLIFERAGRSFWTGPKTTESGGLLIFWKGWVLDGSEKRCSRFQQLGHFIQIFQIWDRIPDFSKIDKNLVSAQSQPSGVYRYKFLILACFMMTPDACTFDSGGSRCPISNSLRVFVDGKSKKNKKDLFCTDLCDLVSPTSF